MATTTYSTKLRLAIPTTGELADTWGNLINTGLTALVDDAIAGLASVAHPDTASYTLTANNAASDEARCAVLKITGALTAARNVVCPTQPKLYVMENATTGGFAVTLKTAAGTGIAVDSGATLLLRCDGTNVVEWFTGRPLGTVALPSYTFAGDTNTGMWSPAADTIAFSSGGGEIARLVISGGNADLTMGGGAVTGPRVTLYSNGTSASPFGAINTTDGRTRIYMNNTQNTASFGVHSGTPEILVGAGAYSAFIGCSGNYDVSFGNNSLERFRLRSTGDVVVTGPGGLGYGTGSGGTVTQATSKSTGVTLNKANGAITMHAASLAATSAIAFTLTNSTVAATDVVVTSIKSGATIGAYSVYVDGVDAGSCQITLRNHTTGALAEAVVISFAVIKAVAA